MRRRAPLSPIERSIGESAVPIEVRLSRAGAATICGVDEAGRGPLAGPVVAAAVVFKDCAALWTARDSKTLSRRTREECYGRIVAELVFAVGVCSVEEIDSLNILKASLLAMERAVRALPEQPDVALIDGLHRPPLSMTAHAIRHGDARVAVISAASIVAKVMRDRMMCELDVAFPGYGFSRHAGYPTVQHRAALRALGPCPIHRKTFHGVRELLSTTSETVA